MRLIENIKNVKYQKYILFLIFALIMVVLIAIRLNLILELPIFAYIDYINDDELMVQQAKSIVSGNWLGTYGYNTFLKGPVFPLYLGLLYFLKIPYLATTTLVYSLACCLFIYSIKDFIKNKLELLIIFILLLFNPIMFSIDFQRVYRNSLTPCLAIILISFYNIVLINRNNPKSIKFIIGIVCASFVFPFFYYIREDSIWIVPFMIFYSFVICMSNLVDIIKCKKFKIVNIIRMLLLVLPLITITIFECVIGNINYKYYQGKVVNMNNFESLNNALHSISIVKDCNEKEKITNSREKITMLYEYSESLNSIKDSFEHAQDLLSGSTYGQLPNGMFGWAFLEGASGSGYDTYAKQEKLFNNISQEINNAIELGKLETQELVPIFGDVNMKSFDLEEFYNQIKLAIKMVNDYDEFSLMDTYGSLYSSDLFEIRIRLFLEMTNDKMLLNDEEKSWISFGDIVKTNQESYISHMQPKVDRLKDIRNIYSNISYTIGIFGYISYLIIFVILIIQTIRKDNKYILNSWLISSGLLGSILVLCVGVAYTTTTKVYATIPFYLMSGYIFNILFCTLSIIGIINFIYIQMSNRRKNKTVNSSKE